MNLIICGKSGCGKTSTLIRIVNELSKYGKIIIIDFHGEYIGLKDLINSEIIDVAYQGLNPLTPIANESYYEIAIDLINSINIVDIYKLGITQESELVDSIISIKDKNLEELYNEINKRSKDEKAGHIRDALIGLKNRIRLLQTGIKIGENSLKKVKGCMPRKLVAMEYLKDIKEWKIKLEYGKRWISETAFSYIKRLFW